MRQILVAMWLLLVMSSGAMAGPLEVEGVSLNDTATISGKQLVLNGAGFHKRGYFKAYVTGLYLPEKLASLDAINKLSGPKRIHLHVLREIPGSTISGYFLNDFKLVATSAEFVKLIDEVGAVGAIYSALPRVYKGDVFWIDWEPGKGMTVTRNGNLIVRGLFTPYLTTPNSELMHQIMLRIYAGAAVPEDLQRNLLGQSTSMSSSAQAER
ncbi:MAG: hypothetical protein A2W72_07340 [Burkholderiales bacterium RIFCSPLOWO2_12_67_14]|nr:MAG: hypothetical protein A3I64_06860 [Burkholderiales bacterium RIFCSPLOWO2_02_FULL_67_64]OGB49376.1 MAG: hypothetical protein A2W72_07340 [Burkholderiales bacterium RIFCSPLOWO2_12_67_14]OGB77309.1 MAG: hypothetical protein A3G82_20425 [Burkholderiales bacterium RIFCSPLOWO2_12_FULL_67_210]